MTIGNDLFYFFIRKNYKEIDYSNEELDDLNVLFSSYLNEKIPEEKLARILPKSEIEVIENMNNPLRQNGFHPAFVLHFLDFIKVEMSKIENK